MMSVADAKIITEKYFPNGPEELARSLGIEIRETPLTGCDGWVLVSQKKTVIRINSNAPKLRQRFTLAHELGHLLLDIPTVIGETVGGALQSNNAEERQVNELAGELLVPESIVRNDFQAPPIVAAQIRKLAKKANVSALVAAIRVTNLASQIGLSSASVSYFRRSQYQWTWSKPSNSFSQEEALNLFQKAKASASKIFRLSSKDTNGVIVASVIENGGNESAMLFVQVLPEKVGSQKTSLEKRQELETALFQGDPQFRNVLQGVMGSFHKGCKDWQLDYAMEQFFLQKSRRFKGEQLDRLSSETGREYIRLRLQEWCKG